MALTNTVTLIALIAKVGSLVFVVANGCRKKQAQAFVLVVKESAAILMKLAATLITT